MAKANTVKVRRSLVQTSEQLEELVTQFDRHPDGLPSDVLALRDMSKIIAKWLRRGAISLGA
jgi:hypothetical protein